MTLWGSLGGTAGALPADEDAAKDQGYPLVIGHNVLWTSTLAPQWRTSGSWLAGSDDTQTGFPTRNLYDGRGNVLTSPSTWSGLAEHHILFQVAPSTGLSGQIDSACLIGHNFDEVDGGDNDLTVQIEASNVASFDEAGGAVSILARWQASLGYFNDPQRLLALDISDGIGDGGATSPSRISNATYLRLKITKGTNFNVRPRLGELFIGRRFQFGGKADRPYPEYVREADVETHMSDNGTTSAATRWYGAHNRTLDMNLGGSNYGTVIPFTNVKDFAKCIRWGSRAFIWIEDGAQPIPELVRFADPKMAFQLIQANGPFEQQWRFDLQEMRPFASTEFEVLT